MDLLLEIWRALTNPDRLIHLLSTVLEGWLAYVLLFGIVFAETGLLVGFFFPGDSLLFTIGVVAGAGKLDVAFIILLLTVAAIAGDQTGFMLGRRTGPRIFDRPDSRFFKRDHLMKTQMFYEKHGGKTIIYARFVPIIRTFAPFIAGVAGMRYGRFVAFNVFGGIGWVVSMVLAGYFLGGIPLIRQHFEKVVLGIVLVSVLPIGIEYLRHRARKKN
ncbi:MAG: VTT domain-containing protein [Bryobacteraceae bacterium]|nr:VTT domain-containing protein [Bryobacteraceae bacterium]